MKKDYAANLRRNLNNLECYGANCLEKLLSYSENIKQVISSLERKKPNEAYSLQGSYWQLMESELCVKSWISHPIKRTMRSRFSEYKRDFISVLDDYIRLGDEYNLWEDVSEKN